MPKALLEKIATISAVAVLAVACWYLSVQVMDTLEFLELAYG